MSLIQSKQIKKFLSGYVYSGVESFGAGLTWDTTGVSVTTLLGTLSATAGDDASSVPSQVSTNTSTAGWIVTGNNVVQVWDDKGLKLVDTNDNEVYGRLTYDGTDFRVRLYTLVNGVETAFAQATAIDLSLVFPYRFSFEKYPGEVATTLASKFISNDPKSGGAPLLELITHSMDYTDPMSPVFTHDDTVLIATNAIDATKEVVLYINGVAYKMLASDGSTGPLDLTAWEQGLVVWQGNFRLETTDEFYLSYYSAGVRLPL